VGEGTDLFHALDGAGGLLPEEADDVECAAADDVAGVEDVGAGACAESAEVDETGRVPGRVSG
jgi:hypothetical protein